MLVKLVGSGADLKTLEDSVSKALSELSLNDFVRVETTDDEAYKAELGISALPALCIEEDSIDFRDMIFEGTVPEVSELVSVFASIFGSDTASGCSSDACGSGCSGCSHG